MKRHRSRLADYEPAKFRRKFNIVVWLVSCAFLILTGKLWYLQVIKGDQLRQRSENNRIRVQEVKPLRGLVMDRNGVILVDNQPSFDVSIIPEDAKDVSAITDRLRVLYDRRGVASFKDVPPVKGRKPFVPVKLDRHIGRDKLAVVETNSLNLPGIVVDVVPVRKYNFGAMLAHVLGYVGEISSAELKKGPYRSYRSDDIVGKYGIEKNLDLYLKGVSGGEQAEVNVAGRKLRILGGVEPVPGYNVMLTVDSAIQKICWDAFTEKAGTAIVMDPRDGSVLAMMSKPSFDPALFNRGISEIDWKCLISDPLCPLQHRAVAGQYPPGSTYKLIVAAAALGEGVVTPRTKINCTGKYTLGDRTYRCWKKGGHGVVDLNRALVESCDVYFYHLGEMLGVDTLASYSRKFGFGVKTGIPLPGEKGGLVPTKRWKKEKLKESWQKGETISLSIGQGFLLVTPLQLIRAYCALANGGTVYRPRLLNRIESVRGEVVREFGPEKESNIPVSPANLEILRKGLWGAVNDLHGTGKACMREEKDVCGKTGTAQVIGMPEEDEDPHEEKVPYKVRDHALFVCFAPCNDPEIVVLVIVEHGGHGGSVAAPIARKIIDGYFAGKKDETVVRHSEEPSGTEDSQHTQQEINDRRGA